MTGRTIVTLMMFCGSLLTGAASAQRFSTEQYVWRIPHDDAGGNCTQFVIHPTDPKLRLVASGDIGLYRWQFDEGRWICISDWNADIHGGYIAGVAVDPTDSSRIFYAAGRGKGDVYVSHDQGRTFTPSKAAWPDGRQLYVNGGEHASTNGPLLAVDPQNPQVLYYASRLDGLWRSVAGSAPASWHRVDRFPARGDVVETFDADGKKLRNLSPTGGLNFIAIDGTSPVIEVDGVSRSSILYVGIGGDLRTQSERGGEVAIERQGGLWRSTDGGQSFQRLADPDDTREHSSGRGYVDSLGNLYAIRSNRLVRVARASDQITDLNVPGERAIRSVAIDPRDPQHLVAARQAVARREHSYEESNRLFRSLDAGKTWVELKNVTFNSPGWWNWFLTPTWWVQFDPHGPTDEAGRSRQFWAGDWLGPWLCEDIGADVPHFEIVLLGRSGTYVIDIATPPAHPDIAIAPLLVACADFDGFRYLSFTSTPPKRLTQTQGVNDGIADGTSIAFAESDPRFMAAVGGWQHGTFGGGGASRDGGVTWEPFEGKGLKHPGFGSDPKLGRVAVGARAVETGVPVLVWIPRFQVPRYSRDFGRTWEESTGAPAGMTPSEWDPWKTLAADPVEPETFYALDNNSQNTGEARVFRSVDGGKTWTHVGGIKGSWAQRRWSRYHLRTMPGRAGEVWVSLDDQFTRPDQEPARGLFRSTDGGASFTRVLPDFTTVYAFAFGAPAEGRDNPSLLVTGVAGGHRAVFMSDDATALTGTLEESHFRRIWGHHDNPMQSIVHCLNSVGADRQTPGRFFVGSTGTGRGVFYGEPASAHATIPTAVVNIEARTELQGVRVTWNDPMGARLYDLYRQRDADEFELLAADLDASSYVDRSLDAPGRVAYRVIAKNAHGASEPGRSAETEPYIRIKPTDRFGTAALHGRTFDRATDGDPRTDFDAASPSSGYAGADFGAPQDIRVIRYVPRRVDRMTGGRFQGSNSREGPWQDIHVIPSAPREGWNVVHLDQPARHRYVRYFGPEGGHANINEFEIYVGGPNAILASTQRSAAGDGKSMNHPILLIEPGGWDAYRARISNDARLHPMRDWVLSEARHLLDQPPLKFETDGRRLLAVSRFTLFRVMVLAQAYRLTGEEAFADRAVREMLSAAGFEHWNPSHFLDTAEMSAALAIGLDWLHEKLTPDQRQQIRRALIDKALHHANENHWFWTSTNNWNQVCITGMTLAAIMVREDAPELSQQIIARARASAKHGLTSYAPDGIPDEGPAYWSYGGTYSAIFYSALQTALEIDPKQEMPVHYVRSGLVRAMLDGPSGEWFGFSDNFGHNRLEPALFFLAKATGQSELAAPTLALLKKLEQHVETVRKEGAVRVWLMPLALVWPAPPAVEGDASRLPRAWTGAGRTPLALLREYGDDGQVAFAGIKGGSPSVSHAHMDIGSFVIDLDGVRWAMDLGAEEYARIEAAMLGLWDMHQESPRWQLLRYHNLQHNTLTIDGQLQRVDGRANTIRVGDAKWPFATIDLSPVYRGQAKRVDRGIRLPDARTVEIVDAVLGVEPRAVLTWTMITDAEIEAASPQTLTLRKSGKTATLTVLSPADARFVHALIDEKRRPFESENPGASAIRLELTGRRDHDIVVRLTTAEAADPKRLDAARPSAWRD